MTATIIDLDAARRRRGRPDTDPSVLLWIRRPSSLWHWRVRDESPLTECGRRIGGADVELLRSTLPPGAACSDETGARYSAESFVDFVRCELADDAGAGDL